LKILSFKKYYYNLVLARDSKVLACIEIKTSTTPGISKGMLKSIEDLDFKNNFNLSLRSASPHKSSKGILLLCLNDFIKVFLPKIIS